MGFHAIDIVRGALAAALFPPKCAACGALAGPGPHADASVFFCPDCLDDYRPAASPKCTVCGMPFDSPHGPDHVCGGCLEKPGRFGRARAVGVYAGPLRTAIHRLKYNGRISLAKPMGRMLTQAYMDHFGAGFADVALPVPLHTKRLRQRGFNQAQLLVRMWGKDCGVTPPVALDVLQRTRMTQSQAGLKAPERAKNIRGAFAVTARAAVRGKRILLVDDVFTTGATANECAKVLLKAGAASVDVLTLAVVMR